MIPPLNMDRPFKPEDLEPATDWVGRLLTNFDPFRRAEIDAQNQKQFKAFLDRRAKKKKGPK
jgi:hypothetical protein